MKIPFGCVSVTKKAERLALQALKNNRLSSGKYVMDFEEKFASLTGTGHAVAVSSGTDAVALALAVLYDFKAKRQDEVIVPALSFVATANAVLQAGFTPVFVDVDRSTLNINPLKIEAAITDKTRAILPVHLMGKPADMDAINSLAKKHKLMVIEDAAEAHGAVYKSRNAGALGDMGAFSLYLAHIITTGEGGIITTNNSEFAGILRSLRSHGRACKCRSCVINTKSSYCARRFRNKDKQDIRFIFERVGFSSKMNELEAAIGLGNLEEYDVILGRRRDNLYYLMRKFKKFSEYFHLPQKAAYEEIGPHAFAAVVRKGAGFTRNRLVDYLQKKGVDTRDLFSCIPTQCRGFAFLGKKRGDFPEAEFIGNNGFHIGVHQELRRGHCGYFINTVEKFLCRYAKQNNTLDEKFA